MKRDGIRTDEEPRDLPRVPEQDGTGEKANTDAGWLETGTEDPAFFIKPSDEDQATP